MARITRVKKAQQRYARVPVTDEQGNAVRTPVINKRTGEQKTTRHGREVFVNPTREDRTKPLPMPTCDYCHKPIEVGQPYKWIQPKSGPYGGHRRDRHAEHPDWNVWDYSSSLSARLAQISHDGWESFNTTTIESEDDFQSILDEVAEAVRELAEEKRESAQNIEDGFGHSTFASDELNETADALEQWADEIESTSIPEIPEPEEQDCEQCDGEGTVDDEECNECEGTGNFTPDDPTDEQLDEWRTELEDALNIIDETPL